MRRLRKLGIVLAVIGVAFFVAGGVAFAMARDGSRSLQKFSEVQNVTLSYNDAGNLVDRGTTEGADNIMALLTEDWGYPVVQGDFDPNDPVVNTASEYMYQMATVAYHTLHGTQTVVLDQPAEYDGVTYQAGTHEFPVEGRYWTDFNRLNPIEGIARGQAWTGTVHGLIAELGVGTVTASALQMAFALAGILAGVGGTFLLTGLGLVWVDGERKEELDYDGFLKQETAKKAPMSV